MRWVLGWIVIPAVVVGAIVGAGAHLGAGNPDAWYARAALWVRDRL